MPDLLVPDTRLVVARSPFRLTDRTETTAPHGQTVVQLLAGVGISPEERVAVFVDGEEVERLDWARVKPRPGCVVCVRALPEGQPGESGGKTALRIVALIAIVVLAIYTGGAAAPLLGLEAGSTGALLVGAGVTAIVSVGGQLAINALIPPPTVKPPRTPSGRVQNAITGSQNVANQWGVMPRVFGTWRIFPCFGALPFQDIHGSRIYYRQLFDCGLGPVNFRDPRIGTTPLIKSASIQYTGVMSTPNVAIGDKVLWCEQKDVRTYNATVTNVREGNAVDLQYQKNGTTKKQHAVPYDLPNTTGTWSWPDDTHPTPAFTMDGEFEGVQMEFRQGYDDDDPITLVDSEVHEEALSIVLKGPAELVPADFEDGGSTGLLNVLGDPLASAGGSGMIKPAVIGSYHPATRRSLVDATALSVDIEFPLGLSRTDGQGGTQSWAVHVQVEYQAVGASSWTKAAPDVGSNPIIISADTGKPRLKSIHWNVSKGQYDVRVTRQTPNPGDGVVDLTVWSTLRTHRALDLSGLKGHGLISMCILASAQLSGVVDAFNVKVTSIIRDWNGTTWDPAPTSNPASIYREILQAKDNHLAISNSDVNAMIDLATLQRWHDNCAANKLFFNGVFDSPGTVPQCLQAVAACGRASRTMRDGKWSVVEDLEQTTPAAWFGPRNSWNCTVNRVFPLIPHALLVRWQDPLLDYKWREEPVYADGYDEKGLNGNTAATVFETLEFPGVDNGPQAWKLGRYNLAVLRDRANQWTRDTDPEGTLPCERGDLVMCGDEFIGTTIAQGRVKAVALDGSDNCTGITIDQACPTDGVSTYGVRIRHDDLTDAVVQVASVSQTVVNGVVLAAIVFASSIAAADVKEKVDDLAFFGIFGSETRRMLVKQVLPSGGMNARLVLIDDAQSVRTADSGTRPEWAQDASGGAPGSPPPSEVAIDTREPTNAAPDPPVVISVSGSNGPATPAPTSAPAAGGSSASSPSSGPASSSSPRITIIVGARPGSRVGFGML